MRTLRKWRRLVAYLSLATYFSAVTYLGAMLLLRDMTDVGQESGNVDTRDERLTGPDVKLEPFRPEPVPTQKARPASSVRTEDVTKSLRLFPPHYTRHVNRSDSSETSQLLEIETEMDERRETMERGCRNHRLNVPGSDKEHSVKAWEYLINREHKLIWCNVFKSGSSSFMYIFNLLAGYTRPQLIRPQKPLMTLARDKYPRPTGQDLVSAMNDSLSFLVARHPFERLVSGYRDKIAGALKHSHHDKLNRDIVQKYRREGERLLRRWKKAIQRGSGKQGDAGTKRFVPTFAEFVQYVMDQNDAGNELDMHWTPVHSFCNPCLLNFSAIVKFETFSRDQEYILAKSGLQHLVQARHLNKAKDGEKSAAVVDSYLGQLSSDLIMGICRLYKVDFDILGYKHQRCQPHANKVS